MSEVGESVSSKEGGKIDFVLGSVGNRRRDEVERVS